MVKAQGQNLNRNTVKQIAGNAKKILGDTDATGVTSLMPSVENWKLRNNQLDLTTLVGLLRQVS